MLSVMRRICRAADIIPESDPRLCFPDCPGFFLKPVPVSEIVSVFFKTRYRYPRLSRFFFKPGTGIRDCPGFFLKNGTGI
jgi:hypothetical protein